jgi:hypothetical protein
LVHRYEGWDTTCRPSPHGLCGGCKVYRSMDVGLSMLRGGVLRSRRELGQTRRPIWRERKIVRRRSWIDNNSRVGDRDWQLNTYTHSVKEPRSLRERYMRAAPMDLRFTSQNFIISGSGDTARTHKIATTVEAGEHVSVRKGGSESITFISYLLAQ